MPYYLQRQNASDLHYFATMHKMYLCIQVMRENVGKPYLNWGWKFSKFMSFLGLGWAIRTHWKNKCRRLQSKLFARTAQPSFTAGKYVINSLPFFICIAVVLILPATNIHLTCLPEVYYIKAYLQIKTTIKYTKKVHKTAFLPNPQAPLCNVLGYLKSRTL